MNLDHRLWGIYRVSPDRPNYVLSGPSVGASSANTTDTTEAIPKPTPPDWWISAAHQVHEYAHRFFPVPLSSECGCSPRDLRETLAQLNRLNLTAYRVSGRESLCGLLSDLRSDATRLLEIAKSLGFE